MKNTDGKKIQRLCRDAFDVKLGDSASLKIQAALNTELRTISNAPAKPVMTITEVADYLRVSSEILENYLGDIPCFELGGKLLFRKDAVDEWIKDRERNYAGEIREFNNNKFLKLTIA